MISARTLAEMAADKSELMLLIPLLQSPDERWKNLQRWLKKNPKWKKYTDKCVELSPNDALEFIVQELCKKWNIPPSLLIALDRTGEMRTVLSTQIIQPIHQAYKERVEFDKQDGRRINSPGKKRKTKKLESQDDNAFHEMNNLPIIDAEVIE